MSDTALAIEIEKQSLDMGTEEFFRSRRRFQSNSSYIGKVAGTPLYQYILNSMDVHAGLRAAVRDSERLVGGMFFGRPRGEPVFSETDERHIDAVLTYVAHAMSHAGDTSPQGESETADGLIVADRRGRVLHMCATAANLRLMIVYPTVFRGKDEIALWDGEIARMASALDRISQGDPALPAGPGAHSQGVVGI